MTISHAPSDYDCPFCRVVRGEASRSNSPDDVVYRDNLTNVWHLHVHVFPRTCGDRLYERHTEVWWPDAGIVSERAAGVRRALASTG